MPDSDPGVVPVPRPSSNAGPPTTGEFPGIAAKKEVRISLSVLIAIIGMMIGAASFAANYLFATKSEIGDARIELLERQSSNAREVHGVKTEIVEVKWEIKAVKKDVEHIRTTQTEYREEQRVIDENLRRLLRREGVRALPKPK